MTAISRITRRVAEKNGHGVIESKSFIDMTGNPAVVGRPVDRWLCGPCFRKVCLEQWAQAARPARVMSNGCDVMSQLIRWSVNQFHLDAAAPQPVTAAHFSTGTPRGSTRPGRSHAA
jgi:deferrochelatase/peroxidase EfeB